MPKAVNAINEIKGKWKNALMIQELHEEFGESYRNLVYHCEMQWLTGIDQAPRLKEFREGPVWMCHLGYLAEISSTNSMS